MDAMEWISLSMWESTADRPADRETIQLGLRRQHSFSLLVSLRAAFDEINRFNTSSQFIGTCDIFYLIWWCELGRDKVAVKELFYF